MNDVFLFEKHCELKKVNVDPYVRDAFQKSMSNGLLDFSGYYVSEKSCEIIGNVIMNTNKISKLKLSDCFISTEGITFILNSLKNNSTVEEVNLYGNNISSEVAKYIGKLLEVTATIKILILNWNNIGQSLDGFAVFCDGLSKNESLEYLDLRNNQLGSCCAKYLSSVILNNNHLKKLDLRWNRLQNEGVEYIQNAISKNTVLSELHLNGNFAHSKIISYVEQQVKQNEEVETMKLEYESKIAFLMKDLKRMEDCRIQNISEISDLANQKIVVMEKRIEETMNKLLFKDENLKQKEKDKKKMTKEALQEKERKLEIMEQLEKVKKENIDLREYLKIKDEEILNLSDISKKSLERERELNMTIDMEIKEKTKIIENLKNELQNQQSTWENRFKRDTETLETTWKSKLTAAEEKSIVEIENMKRISLNENSSKLKEKGLEVDSLKKKIDKVLNEKSKHETELIEWKTKADNLYGENCFLQRKIINLEEEVKSLTEDLKMERINHNKTKENFKMQIEDVNKLKEIIEQQKNDLSNEKMISYNLSKELNETNYRWSIEREEEKLRTEFLSAALKRFLSTSDGPTIV